MLKNISVCLDKYRNFMMHSDDSKITKVDTHEDAEKRLMKYLKNKKNIRIF